jgi:hypothetical protein
MIISKKPPYQNTNVDPEQTQSDINKMLRAYGVNVSQWTTDYEKLQVSLSFRVDQTVNGKTMTYNIRTEPPTFAKQRRTWDAKLGKNIKKDLPNWAASFRFLYNRVKTRLEEVAYGGSTVEQAFLSDIIVNLPNGGTSTMYQALKNADVYMDRLNYAIGTVSSSISNSTKYIYSK